MTSSRRTGTNEIVKTFGTSGAGRDYADPLTWETDFQGDQVTLARSPVLEGYADATEYNNRCHIAGSTCNATYFMDFRAASGHEHKGDINSGVYLHNQTSSPGAALRHFDNYCSYQDLMVSEDVTNANPRYVIEISTGGNNSDCVGIFVRFSINAGTGDGRGGYAGSTGTIRNCLFQDADDDGWLCLGGTITIENCNSHNNGGTGFSGGSTNYTIKNSIATGNGGVEFGSTWNSNSDYNVSSDSSAPGSNSKTNQTPTFVDSTNDDWHLASTDTVAKDAGTDLSASFDDDVDLETRSGSWDIGFDEYIAAGGGGNDGAATYHYRQLMGVY